MGRQMLKYRIFFIGYGGALWDAFVNKAIPVSVNYDCIDDAVCDLAMMKQDGKVNNDLTYVFLPIYCE